MKTCSPVHGNASHLTFTVLLSALEVDLLLVWPDGEQWAIEIKRSLTPKLEKEFYSACQDLHPSQKWVVYAGQERYPLAKDIQAISLYELCQIVSNK